MFNMVSGNLDEIANVSTEACDKLVDGIDLHEHLKAPCTRTNSLPVNRMPPSQVRRHWRAKRAASSALNTLHEVSRRNEAWIKKTDELFRSLRLQRSSSGESPIPSVPHTRRSSRQMSHHSSSSEEWYEEFLKPSQNETGGKRIPIVQTRISEVSERQSNDDELIQQTSSVIDHEHDSDSRRDDPIRIGDRLDPFREESPSRASHSARRKDSRKKNKKKNDERNKRKCMLCSIL